MKMKFKFHVLSMCYKMFPFDFQLFKKEKAWFSPQAISKQAAGWPWPTELTQFAHPLSEREGAPLTLAQ